MIWGNNIEKSEGVEISEFDTRIDAHIGKIKIGKNSKILDGVKIWTHNHEWNPYSPEEIPTELVIGENVIVGAYSLILPQCTRIGDGSIIGAGSVVTKDIPAREMWAGNPAKCKKKLYESGPMFREVYPDSIKN